MKWLVHTVASENQMLERKMTIRQIMVQGERHAGGETDECECQTEGKR